MTEILGSAPISLPAQAQNVNEDDISDLLAREVGELGPWYDLAVQKTGRTTVGSSGLDMPTAAEFVITFLSGDVPESPVPGERVDRALKWACDDLKAYYYEASLAQPGSPASTDLDDWFWGGTTAGSVLLSLQKVMLASDDETFQLIGKQFLIPRSQLHRAAPD